MIFNLCLGHSCCASCVSVSDADPLYTLLRVHRFVTSVMASDHVNGNGTEEPMDTSSTATRSENFQALLQAGLPQKVAEKLDEIYIAGENAVITHA